MTAPPMTSSFRRSIAMIRASSDAVDASNTHLRTPKAHGNIVGNTSGRHGGTSGTDLVSSLSWHPKCTMGTYLEVLFDGTFS